MFHGGMSSSHDLMTIMKKCNTRTRRTGKVMGDTISMSTSMLCHQHKKEGVVVAGYGCVSRV
jgi:hypothetical protein